MITVREIAEFAGVSKSTVSLVLNNKPGVSDQMRKTVFDARTQLETIRADEIMPQQSIVETLSTQSQMVSMMVLHPPVLRSSNVFTEVLHGIQSAAELYKLQLRLVANIPQASEQHVSNLYLTDDYLRPDGIVVFGAERQEPVLQKVVDLNIPCVVLGREAKKYNVSGIERDEVYYSYVITRHLLDLGHRSVAFVGGDMRYDYTLNRIKGYQQAMGEAGIADTDYLICLDNGATAMTNILSNVDDLTAVVFINDTYAAEGLTVLQAHELQVPDDISVVSFDNTRFAQGYTPPLTSIAYNHFKEGQWAVKMLLDEIRHPFIKKSQFEFDGELIVRESTRQL